jgi:glycerol-3-phosphate dehydrogenase
LRHVTAGMPGTHGARLQLAHAVQTLPAVLIVACTALGDTAGGSYGPVQETVRVSVARPRVQVPDTLVARSQLAHTTDRRCTVVMVVSRAALRGANRRCERRVHKTVLIVIASVATARAFDRCASRTHFSFTHTCRIYSTGIRKRYMV